MLRTITCAAALLGFAAVTQAQAQEPFYKGKRLTLLVNFDAGSATDIDARVFARHFIKHIDGAPQLVIQNMPGGGGANGTMYLGEVQGDGSVKIVKVFPKVDPGDQCPSM